MGCRRFHGHLVKVEEAVTLVKEGGLSMPQAARELLRVIRLPAVREQLVAQGAEVSTMPPAEITRFVEVEMKHWAQVVSKAGLKLE